jgi:membrane-bound lytic murein transglycosylase D
VASIARTYRVPISDLAEVNDLSETAKLDGVEALVVPVAPAAAPSAHTVYYTTRRGDTLVSVADRFGVSLTQLRRWNRLPSAGIKIEAGRRLHVAQPTVVRTSSRSRHGKGRTRETARAEAPAHAASSSHRSSSKARSSGGNPSASSSKTAAKTKHGSRSSKHSSHGKSSSRAEK